MTMMKRIKNFVKPLSRRNTVSEEEVVEAEDLLDKLLEHVLDLIGFQLEEVGGRQNLLSSQN